MASHYFIIILFQTLVFTNGVLVDGGVLPPLQLHSVIEKLQADIGEVKLSATLAWQRLQEAEERQAATEEYKAAMRDKAQEAQKEMEDLHLVLSDMLSEQKILKAQTEASRAAYEQGLERINAVEITMASIGSSIGQAIQQSIHEEFQMLHLAPIRDDVAAAASTSRQRARLPSVSDLGLPSSRPPLQIEGGSISANIPGPSHVPPPPLSYSALPPTHYLNSRAAASIFGSSLPLSPIDILAADALAGRPFDINTLLPQRRGIAPSMLHTRDHPTATWKIPEDENEDEPLPESPNEDDMAMEDLAMDEFVHYPSSAKE